jgi:cytochrome c553
MNDDYKLIKELVKQMHAELDKGDKMIAEAKKGTADAHMDNTVAHEQATAHLAELAAEVAAHPEATPWKAGQGKRGTE